MLITQEARVRGEGGTRGEGGRMRGQHAWKNGMLIQDAMPQVSAPDREFIKSGITNEEWNNLFKEIK